MITKLLNVDMHACIDAMHRLEQDGSKVEAVLVSSSLFQSWHLYDRNFFVQHFGEIGESWLGMNLAGRPCYMIIGQAEKSVQIITSKVETLDEY